MLKSYYGSLSEADRAKLCKIVNKEHMSHNILTITLNDAIADGHTINE
ncbi:MAG: hypothetical protein IKR73_01325 [Oscillospiraceae bacterium]|nr:hypothetical protein [Oscillospiraceae bacterium]